MTSIEQVSQEQPAPLTEEETVVPAQPETLPAAAEGESAPAAATERAETAQSPEAPEPKEDEPAPATGEVSAEAPSTDAHASQTTTETETAEAPAAAEPEKAVEEEDLRRPSAQTQGTEPPDPRAHWMPDDSATACSECGSEFTFVRRRHHCRMCGRLFCGDCTQQTFELPPQYGWKGPQRVCESCYLILYSRKELGVSPVPK